MIARLLSIPLGDWKLIFRDVFTGIACLAGAYCFTFAMGSF